jgi:hypothetical protein
MCSSTVPSSRELCENGPGHGEALIESTVQRPGQVVIVIEVDRRFAQLTSVIRLATALRAASWLGGLLNRSNDPLAIYTLPVGTFF